MPTLVDIPNIGEVEFPDGMSDADIAAAAHKLANPKPWYSGAGAFMDAYKRNAEMMKNDPNSAFGQALKQNEAGDRPSITLPRAPQAESTLGQVVSGVYNGAIAPAVETMTSPNAVRSLPVAAAGRVASAVIAPVMGAGAVQQGAEAIKQAGNPDATLQQIVEPAAGAVSSAAMAVGAGRHATKTPKNNANRGENTATPAELAEGNQEATTGIQAASESIQDVSRVPDVQGGSAGGAGRSPYQPQGEGIEPKYEGEIQQGAIPGGTAEVRDPVRELPPEAPRGETPAAAQPASRTIETVGEGQLFRNDEIPFNLAGETDASAAEAAAAAEIKSQEAAKTAQDAAQTKMFEEPADVIKEGGDVVYNARISGKNAWHELKAWADKKGITLNDDQIVEITKQSERMFNESVVSGDNIPAFHGSRSSERFSEFRPGPDGFSYFTTDRQTAEGYADPMGMGGTAGLYEVRLKAKNPKIYREANEQEFNDFTQRNIQLGPEHDSAVLVDSDGRALDYAIPHNPESPQISIFGDKTEPTTPVVDQNTAKVSDKPAGNPLMDALDADLKAARAAGDKDKVRTLAALKVNYLLRKPPALRQVEKAYGEPTLPVNKARGDKPMTKTQLFSEGPVARWIIENGGFMSASEARRVKGREWWERTGKGMYEALGRIPPAYGRLVFKKGAKGTPDDLMSAVGLRNAGNEIEGSPFGPNDTHHELLSRLMEEVESAKGGKSARGVTKGIKSYEQHMEEQSALHEQQASTKGLHLSVDEMSPGDTLKLPADSGGGTAKVIDVDPDGNVTIQMPKGVTVTMPSGNSLKVADHIRSEGSAAGADEPF